MRYFTTDTRIELIQNVICLKMRPLASLIAVRNLEEDWTGG